MHVYVYIYAYTPLPCMVTEIEFLDSNPKVCVNAFSGTRAGAPGGSEEQP